MKIVYKNIEQRIIKPIILNHAKNCNAPIDQVKDLYFMLLLELLFFTD